MIHSTITFLPSSDNSKMYEFYNKVLELRLHKDQGKCMIFASGNGYVGFCNHYANHDPVGVICFVVESIDEVDRFYNKMMQFGSKTEGVPVQKKEYMI